MINQLKRAVQPVPQPASASIALLVLRLVVGTAFTIHGWQKIQDPFGWMGQQSPVPGLFQFLAAISEFGGGIAWIIGLLTPLAALGIGCTMTVAVFMHSMVLHDPFVSLTGGRSYELASAYLCIALLLLALGPGRFSLDAKVFGERN
jgi:putative oxidoreductase